MDNLFTPPGLVAQEAKQLIIKFSHHYPKLRLWNGTWCQRALLMQVSVLELSEQHITFLKYDTDNFRYKLPEKGAYIQLLFKKMGEGAIGCENLFTTLRPMSSEKWLYYCRHIGSVFALNYTKG